MNNMQYTIRSVPQKLDLKLRDQARKSGKSLNETILESLAKGAGLDIASQTFHDLDWFAGSQSLDTEFDNAINWLNSLPTNTSSDIAELSD